MYCCLPWLKACYLITVEQGWMQPTGLNMAPHIGSVRAVAKLHAWQVLVKKELSMSPLASSLQHADASPGSQVGNWAWCQLPIVGS